jgi:hypothetical protein
MLQYIKSHIVVSVVQITELFKSIPITTKIVSSNPSQVGCTRYNIMWLSFVSDLWQVGGFFLHQQS